MLKRTLYPVLALSTFLVTTGCTADSEPDVQTFRTYNQEIKGGEIDRDHPAVVGIAMVQRGYVVGACSGTLIAPNLVLTAHHCVAQTSTSYIQCGSTSFGSTHTPSMFRVTTNTYLNPNGYQVKEIRTGEKGDVCGNDLALMILSENVPESEATPIVPRIDEKTTRGEGYTAIGYGHVGDNSGSGVRRILENRSIQCEGANCPRYAQVLDGEFMGSSGTCQGDSGGPAIDGQGRVLGALSRGAGQCQTSTYSAIAGKWSDWVIEVGGVAAEQGGYETPFWVEYGVSEIPEDDIDLDGVLTESDNCPETFNEDQADVDGDGLGDPCDDNSDTDEILDPDDNCPLLANPEQIDVDGDGFGNACDQDDDDDGIEDDADFCPEDVNFSEYGDPCGTDPDTMIVVLQDENQKGGCQKSSTASGAPTGVIGGIFLLLGMMLRRRRRG